MSRLYGIWRALGIAKTSETAAIRSAYARVLKSFEVDDDPARFETLRNARDQALAYARNPPQEDADDDDDSADEAPTTLGMDMPMSVGLFTPLLTEPDLPPESLVSVTPDPAGDGYRHAPGPAPTGEEITLPPVDAGLTTPVLDLPDDTASLLAIGDETASFIAEMDRRYDAVVAILFPPGGHTGPMLSGQQLTALRDHVSTLLADPRMEQIAFREDADRWFANVLAQAIPFSDSLLDQVAAAFGWMEHRGRIDQPPAVAAIVARCESLAFVEQVRTPGHPLNSAWRELTRHAQEGSRKTFGVSGGKVRQLLARIRQDHPDLEDRLDWYRVSLWDKPQVSDLAGNWRPWAIGIFFILFVLNALGRIPDDRRSGTPVPVTFSTAAPMIDPLIDMETDLDLILARLGGSALTMKALQQHNPKLHGQLASNWRLAQENRNSRFVFAKDTRALLVDRYVNGMRRAGYDLLADDRRLWVEKAKGMRGHGYEACDNFFKDGDIPQAWQTPTLVDRQTGLIGRALLETNGDPIPEAQGGKFSIAGSVIDAASKRAGLSRELFVKSMNDGGTPKSRCEARIALIEVVLTLPPKQALPLLRNI